jgi:hypothetical protein
MRLEVTDNWAGQTLEGTREFIEKRRAIPERLGFRQEAFCGATSRPGTAPSTS